MPVFIRIIFLLLVAGVLFGAGPSTVAKKPVDIPGVHYPTMLKTGDIVLRSGKGFISRMFRDASTHDRVYSHAGIVLIREGKPMVVHFIEEQGKKVGLHIDPVEVFCDPSHNDAFAIFRYDQMTGHETELRNFIIQTFRSNMAFDEQFNLESDDSYYCSEFVYKAILFATGNRLPVTQLNGFRYVAPDNLYLNSFATCIFSSSNPDS